MIADAVDRTVKANKPLTRSNLRDAIQATKMNSIQGPIAFDENGDITNRTVSSTSVRDGEFKYVGVAPAEVGAIRRSGPARRRRPGAHPPMSLFDVLLQQVVNGLALGMMYALLALGFTMVYGIIELINFAHFSVFMTGTFVGIIVLDLMGITAVSKSLTGLPLVGTLVVLFVATMALTGLLGVLIERICLRPVRHVSGTAPMITTIGVAFILINVMLLRGGRRPSASPSSCPNWRWQIGQADITFKLDRALRRPA